MKTIIRSLCIVGLLLGGITAGRADEAASAKKEAPEHKQAPELTPEQREIKRKEAKAKFDAQLKELREKKAAGKLTEEEAKKLERLEKRAANQKDHEKGGADHKAKQKAEHKAEHKAEAK